MKVLGRISDAGSTPAASTRALALLASRLLLPLQSTPSQAFKALWRGRIGFDGMEPGDWR